MSESTLENYNQLAGAVITGTHPILPRPEWGQDCAYLAHVLDTQSLELVALRKEVREWMCRECRWIYPGPPQPGLKAVVCPRCQGATLPRGTLELMEAHELLTQATAAKLAGEELRFRLQQLLAKSEAITFEEVRSLIGKYDWSRRGE